MSYRVPKLDGGNKLPAKYLPDVTEQVQDIVAAMVRAGTNVTGWTYDDAAGTLTLNVAGGGGATDPEVVRDTIASALVGGTNITVTANDAADTITVTTTATANATDAALRDRSTHTGTQAASTITGLATVATSGAYTDLTAKPTIPTVGAAGAGAAVALSSTDATTTNTRTPTDGTVTDAKVATGAAIALSKLATDPLARVNHTGTQAASTVTGLATVATSGAYADLSGKPTIPLAPADIGAEVKVWDQSRVPSPVGSMISKGAILTLGTAGQFDAGYLESPSVFFDPANGLLTMVYTGYTLPTGDPATVASVGYATSPDGITWTKQGQLFAGSGIGGSPDQSGATAPVMVTDSAGVYHLFYLGLTAAGYEGGGPSGIGGICHATATSLAGPWTRQGAVIQKSGVSASSWRWYGVWHPNLVYANNRWYLFFNASGNDGQGHTNVETIGYATSTSLNGPWTVDDVNSPVIRQFNAADQVIGDPFVWREGDHWRMDMYRADSTGTTIGAYYATTTDALFPLGWTHRGQVTSAAANQGAKPSPVRFNGSVYYYASYGVNIFLNVAPDVTTRNATVSALWQFAPDRSASGRASAMVGDDINLTLGTGTKSLMVGGSASNSYLVLGQSNSRNLLTYWQYSATASAAIAKMETFGGSNPLNIQQNTGSLMLGGSGGKVGFYGITPVSKPALTYSRATENAADTALRGALVALGLVTDSTTA